jgi:hypothetical protein
MKVFLQNSVNLAYLANHGQWTWNREGALSFASTVLARQRCHSGDLRGMVLVVCHSEALPPYDIRIAIEDGRGLAVSSELIEGRRIISAIVQLHNQGACAWRDPQGSESGNAFRALLTKAN